MAGNQALISRWRSPDGTRDRPVVLVVEDDPDAWRIFGYVLWYNGFDVIHAPDGQSGYHSAKSFRPDLILLDLSLPDADGLELCGMLRAEGDAVPVVALTSRSRAEAGERADREGFTDYLEKSTHPVKVLHTVESLIGRAPTPGEGRPPLKSSAD
jgi:DNA-binding response OmpR family regulator